MLKHPEDHTSGARRGAGFADPPQVLLIEDDRSLREAMAAALEASGYRVIAASHGGDIEVLSETAQPVAAILDVRLPEGPDGFTLAAQLRAQSALPLVFVTAADDLEHRLRGFDVGADDYLVKPFAMSELLARLHAVMRRAGRLPAASWTVCDLTIDDTNRTVQRSGHDLELTNTEYDLLTTFARSPGQVLSKSQLLTLVWGFQDYAPNLVEVHVSALRRKLELYGPRLVHTARNAGYVLRT